MPLNPDLTVHDVVDIIINSAQGAKFRYSSLPEVEKTEAREQYFYGGSNALYFILSAMGFSHEEIVTRTQDKFGPALETEPLAIMLTFLVFVDAE